MNFWIPFHYRWKMNFLFIKCNTSIEKLYLFHYVVTVHQWIVTDFSGSSMMRLWKWLTLNVRGPSNLGLIRSISWLLMPWLLTSPGHQQPWYWPGLGYWYSVLVLPVLEYWIFGTRTVLILVSSKVMVLVLVLVLMDKFSCTRTSTGTSTDILWYIWDVRVKAIIPVK